MDVQSFPRVRRGEIEVIGHGTATLWDVKVQHPLEVVLSPGFFGAYGRDQGMREHDRIQLTCDIGSGSPTYADLVVVKVISPQRADPAGGIVEVKADVIVRPLRWEAPAKARAA